MQQRHLHGQTIRWQGAGEGDCAQYHLHPYVLSTSSSHPSRPPSLFSYMILTNVTSKRPCPSCDSSTGLIYVISLVPTRASGSLASLSVGFTSLDHCIDTLSATVRGGSLVRTGLSVCVKGSFRVLILRCTPGDTTLSELGQSNVFPKVGTLSYNWSTIGRACSLLGLHFTRPLY